MWKLFRRQASKPENVEKEFRIPILAEDIKARSRELMNVEHVILLALLTRMQILKEKIFVEMSQSAEDTLFRLEAKMNLEEDDDAGIESASSRIVEGTERARQHQLKAQNLAAEHGFVWVSPSEEIEFAEMILDRIFQDSTWRDLKLGFDNNIKQDLADVAIFYANLGEEDKESYEKIVDHFISPDNLASS